MEAMQPIHISQTLTDTQMTGILLRAILQLWTRKTRFSSFVGTDKNRAKQFNLSDEYIAIPVTFLDI
jgi:hypothetical protein